MDVTIASFVNEGLGHSSYLVDLGDRTALVIDPARIPTAQVAHAAEGGLRIAYTADTHTHADYVSGGPDLAARGATFLAPAAANLGRENKGLADGDIVEVGRYRLAAIATPGHTPDHLAYLLADDTGPVALFSGGSRGCQRARRRDARPGTHRPAVARRAGLRARGLSTGEIFALTSFKEKALSSCSQAGMVNNLNDGLAWGLFPLYFAAAGLSLARIGILAALYPAVWGLGQLVTGGLSDRIGRKWLIAGGMFTQAFAIALIGATTGFCIWAASALLLGAGTAMVYPTLLAAIGDVAPRSFRFPWATIRMRPGPSRSPTPTGSAESSPLLGSLILLRRRPLPSCGWATTRPRLRTSCAPRVSVALCSLTHRPTSRRKRWPWPRQRWCPTSRPRA